MGSFGFGLLAAMAIGLQWASPSWARVGVTSVIDGQPKGLPPQGVERILNVGNDMQPNERVTTGANDKAYIVFLDGTSLAVGPNSVLTIDKFVYDPQRKTGELALNASRGVFRLVGGAISKNSEININTPSATMGIRGGIATFAVTASGATTANFLFGGSLTVTSQGVTQTTTQPGSQIRAPVGAPPTPPAAIPPGSLGNSNNSFQGAGDGQQGGGVGAGPPGSGGGRPSVAAIGAAIASSGLSRSNSAMAPAAALAAVPATQQAQLKVVAVTPAATTAAASQQMAVAAPQQGLGPLAAANPSQGARALEGASPLQSAAPLQAEGPLQAVGPLQATAPSAAFAPQTIDLAALGVATGPAAGLALVAGIPAAASAAGSNIQSLNQLIGQILAGPNAPSPEGLTFLVNTLAPPPPPIPTPVTLPLAPPASTAVSTVPPIAQPANMPPPGTLPPPVYNTVNQSRVSPN